MSEINEEISGQATQFSKLLDVAMSAGVRDGRMVSYARLTKLSEEAGELSAAVLRNMSHNILKEDGTVTREEVGQHILSLAVTVLAFYEHWTNNQETVMDDLREHMEATLMWAREQMGA